MAVFEMGDMWLRWGRKMLAHLWWGNLLESYEVSWEDIGVVACKNICWLELSRSL
jgi:hypothetical protein